MKNLSRTKRSQRGSAHIWIIIVLILVVAGLLGVVLWQQLSQTDSKSSDETTQSSNASTSTTNTPKDGVQTATDISAYVQSFEYPANWKIVTGSDISDKYNYMASPPEFLLVDASGKERMYFVTPQSASDTPIDTEASNRAGNGGKIVSGFTTLDGLPARKIEFSDGKAVVVTLTAKGYAYVAFASTTTSSDIDAIISSWQWQ